MFYVEVNRGDGWTLVGQYADRYAAERIATDYRVSGVRVRITTDDE
jgi:hypothetical protein